MPETQTLQPWLHDKLVLLHSPCQLWSNADGSIDGGPVTGLYVGDTRLVSTIVTDIDGDIPVSISVRRDNASTRTMVSVPRALEGQTADPRFRVLTTEQVVESGFEQHVAIESGRDDDVRVAVRVTIVPDMSTMQEIKGGARSETLLRGEIRAAVETDGLRIEMVRATHSRSTRRKDMWCGTEMKPCCLGALMFRRMTWCSLLGSFQWSPPMPLLSPRRGLNVDGMDSVPLRRIPASPGGLIRRWKIWPHCV